MEKREIGRILSDETVTCGGMFFRYRLIDAEGEPMRFRMSVTSGSECEEVSLGNDICFAADCYRSVRDGYVTPCTLCEMIEELFTGAVFLQNPFTIKKKCGIIF